MDQVKIDLHGEGITEPLTVVVDKDVKIKEIVEIFAQNSKGVTVEEVEVFFEDETEPRQKEHHCEEGGIKKRHHIHCHRCKKVKCAIDFNGVTKLLTVPPSMRGETLLKLVGREFGITEIDLTNMELKFVSTEQVLLPNEHIGTFVTYPKCETALNLVPIKSTNG
ncbi:MAG: hypothetical protein ACLQQ4_07385 [Bacteroidia bacterium]